MGLVVVRDEGRGGGGLVDGVVFVVAGRVGEVDRCVGAGGSSVVGLSDVVGGFQGVPPRSDARREWVEAEPVERVLRIGWEEMNGFACKGKIKIRRVRHGKINGTTHQFESTINTEPNGKKKKPDSADLLWASPIREKDSVKLLHLRSNYHYLLRPPTLQTVHSNSSSLLDCQLRPN